MKSLLFIAGLLGLLAVSQQTDVASLTHDFISNGQQLGSAKAERRVFTQAKPLKGRPLCGLELLTSIRYTPAPKGLSRRSDEENEAGNSTSDLRIFERQMTLPQGSTNDHMKDFMLSETGKKGYNFLAWRPRGQKISRDVNNAVFEPIRNTRSSKAFGQGLHHLAGCTGLMIVSRKGIYGGHYWENIGFDLEKPMHGDLYKDQEDAFQKSILDALEKGSTDGGHPALTEAAKIMADDDTIKAYLMVPDTGPSEEGEEAKPEPYKEHWRRMQEKIGEIIPKLSNIDDANRWQVVTYYPVQDEERSFEYDRYGRYVLEDGKPKCTYDPLDDTTRGRMLCKYDPDHNGKKKIALWIENRQYHDDSW
ncbi:hypothetical protein G6O67_006170 [Ophiocordyceps sinensis]|uniref:Heat-labile enterotoxin IIA, A chain n=1 Tax=Ophiocordyceps sinensis TaxID=72228 RepID=A0A8H4PLT0_9HYPO|nr:hypothetical protein G6O67_006170 [Ophiocordyceps sinensis]